MMDYNCTNVAPPYETPGTPVPPTEPLSAVMDQADRMATEALIMARRIRQHLFGANKDPQKEGEKPECFRDVLTHQRMTLGEVVEELARIIDELGV